MRRLLFRFVLLGFCVCKQPLQQERCKNEHATRLNRLASDFQLPCRHNRATENYFLSRYLYKTITSPYALLTAITDAGFERYGALLLASPVITKSVSAGTVCAFGDGLSQIIEAMLESNERSSWNMFRTFSVGAEGLLVSGPILHFAYDYMDRISLDVQSEYASAGLQTAIDIFVLDSLFTATFMISSALLDGKSVSQILADLRVGYLQAARAALISSLMMLPLQFLNFGYCPLRFRVLATNCQDMVWTAAVSFSTYKQRRKLEVAHSSLQSRC